MANKMTAKKLTLAAIFTAIVIILQLIGTFTTFFGPFSTAVALIPIVLGAALCGAGVGAWLGFVFGVVVLLSGGAALFLAFSVYGTIITVLVKGTACGFAAGLIYKLISKFNRYIAVAVSGVTCAIVNTGFFLLGSFVFFLKDSTGIAQMVGMNESGAALFIALAFGNFLFEVGMTMALTPVIARLIDIKKK